MIKRPDTNAQRLKRHKRVRGKVSGTSERPRLNVFRSGTNIYAQIIDDSKGCTLVSASSWKRDLKARATTARLLPRSARPLASGPRTRASTLWSLTAAATCTTVG